jgi:hypothetical protein
MYKNIILKIKRLYNKIFREGYKSPRKEKFITKKLCVWLKFWNYKGKNHEILKQHNQIPSSQTQITLLKKFE